MKRWTKYFNDLLNINSNATDTNEEEEVENDEDIQTAIRTIKTGKFLGHGRISSEMIKNIEEIFK